MLSRPILLTAVAAALAFLWPHASFAGKKTAETRSDTTNASVTSVPAAKILAASKKIDQLIEADLAKNKIKPNAMTTDEVFLRRAYLDIVGRIPSHDEAVAFLDSKDADKRAKLIDRLLDSEGYVSHNFNYWADLLRIQSRMRYAPAQPYIDFVKNSLRDNKPYDQFVRELITAEGYTWDNGAAGYYLRDTGMPLDNMSNTVQVFLGTQLVCAQCHNHPFDSWTQMEYYQLAAFTYGIETTDRRNTMFAEMRTKRREGKIEDDVFRAANQILRPLAYKVKEGNRKLPLPHDYAYNDAKPKTVVKPLTIFGDKLTVKPGESPREVYANWMTSPRNPRFTTVIANRLWKRVMGLGLIEPVDDFKSGVKPSNPEAMKYLTELMVELKYDMKQYFRVLYNSKTYQRMVTTNEIVEGETYRFPGPVLRRLSAEQLWDSFLTLTIASPDERKGLPTVYNRYTDGEKLVGMKIDDILKLAENEAKRRTAQVKFAEQTRDLQKDLRVATRTNDREKVNELRQKLTKIRKEVFGDLDEQQQRDRTRRNNRDTDPRWASFPRELVRASELESPARPGHFLRQFGQSDRETIENANNDASVPQILTLLNGPMYNQLSNRQAVLNKAVLSAETPEKKLEAVFLSILSRRPTERDRALTLPLIEKTGNRGVADVVWALLNTRQFMFNQ